MDSVVNDFEASAAPEIKAKTLFNAESAPLQFPLISIERVRGIDSSMMNRQLGGYSLRPVPALAWAAIS
jgi:hypothetical protein